MVDIEKLGCVIADRLEALRKEPLSEKLSKKIKKQTGISISKSCMGNYEKRADDWSAKKGTNLGMNVKYLCALADYYGVTTDYILGRSESPFPVDADMTTLIDGFGFSKTAAAKLENECKLLRRFEMLNRLIEQKEFVELLDALGRCETLNNHDVEYKQLLDGFASYLKEHDEEEYNKRKKHFEKEYKLVVPSEEYFHKYGTLYAPQNIIARIAKRFIDSNGKEGNDAISTEENEQGRKDIL